MAERSVWKRLLGAGAAMILAAMLLIVALIVAGVWLLTEFGAPWQSGPEG